MVSEPFLDVLTCKTCHRRQLIALGHRRVELAPEVLEQDSQLVFAEVLSVIEGDGPTFERNQSSRRTMNMSAPDVSRLYNYALHHPNDFQLPYTLVSNEINYLNKRKVT